MLKLAILTPPLIAWLYFTDNFNTYFFFPHQLFFFGSQRRRSFFNKHLCEGGLKAAQPNMHIWWAPEFQTEFNFKKADYMIWVTGLDWDGVGS